MIYYTSDLHFGHKNILKYESNRPGKDIEEHDNELIERINSKCSINDNLFILGDLTFWKDKEKNIELISKLKPKLYLCKGNHDFWVKSNYMNYLFVDIQDYFRIKDEGRDVVLFHYPIFNWDNQKHGSYHLYGHVHNKLNFQLNQQNSFNVGCMLHNYYPVTLDELINQDDILNLKINKMHRSVV